MKHIFYQAELYSRRIIFLLLSSQIPAIKNLAKEWSIVTISVRCSILLPFAILMILVFCKLWLRIINAKGKRDELGESLTNFIIGLRSKKTSPFCRTII